MTDHGHPNLRIQDVSRDRDYRKHGEEADVENEEADGYPVGYPINIVRQVPEENGDDARAHRDGKPPENSRQFLAAFSPIASFAR